MLHEPLLKRRDALTDLLGPVRKKPSAIELSQTVTASANDMIRAITELGLEGIIAKRQDSLYEPGKRSGAWVKYKVNKGQEFVVGGYTPGNPFDAVIVGYYQGKTCSMPGKFAPASCPMYGAKSWPGWNHWKPMSVHSRISRKKRDAPNGRLLPKK